VFSTRFCPTKFRERAKPLSLLWMVSPAVSRTSPAQSRSLLIFSFSRRYITLAPSRAFRVMRYFQARTKKKNVYPHKVLQKVKRKNIAATSCVLDPGKLVVLCILCFFLSILCHACMMNSFANTRNLASVTFTAPGIENVSVLVPLCAIMMFQRGEM